MTFLELKNNDNTQNQIPVATAKYIPYASLTTSGVSADTATANTDKKNSVAFGFRPLVKKTYRKCSAV